MSCKGAGAGTLRLLGARGTGLSQLKWRDDVAGKRLWKTRSVERLQGLLLQTLQYGVRVGAYGAGGAWEATGGPGR